MNNTLFVFNTNELKYNDIFLNSKLESFNSNEDKKDFRINYSVKYTMLLNYLTNIFSPWKIEAEFDTILNKFLKLSNNENKYKLYLILIEAFDNNEYENLNYLINSIFSIWQEKINQLQNLRITDLQSENVNTVNITSMTKIQFPDQNPTEQNQGFFTLLYAQINDFLINSALESNDENNDLEIEMEKNYKRIDDYIIMLYDNKPDNDVYYESTDEKEIFVYEKHENEWIKYNYKTTIQYQDHKLYIPKDIVVSINEKLKTQHFQNFVNQSEDNSFLKRWIDFSTISSNSIVIDRNSVRTFTNFDTSLWPLNQLYYIMIQSAKQTFKGTNITIIHPLFTQEDFSMNFDTSAKYYTNIFRNTNNQPLQVISQIFQLQNVNFYIEVAQTITSTNTATSTIEIDNVNIDEVLKYLYYNQLKYISSCNNYNDYLQEEIQQYSEDDKLNIPSICISNDTFDYTYEISLIHKLEHTMNYEQIESFLNSIDFANNNDILKQLIQNDEIPIDFFQTQNDSNIVESEKLQKLVNNFKSKSSVFNT